MINVILAKSYADAVEVANQPKKWVAIETEYGNEVLGEEHPNVVLACNHHGDLQLNDAPAIQCSKHKTRYDNFIISHIDIDVLFGILWSAGWLKRTDTTRALSELVAKADVNGFHIIEPILDTMPLEIKEKYYAIGYLLNSWVFNDDGLSKKDISKEVHKLLLRIKDIIVLGATPEQIALYETWLIEQKKIVKQHLISMYRICKDEHMFVFQSGFSLSTAYNIDGIKASIIIQYNEQSKSITLSCYDDTISKKYFGDKGVIEPLVKFFGKGAGGKMSVGGTPRSSDIQPEMLDAFVQFLFREYLNIPDIKKIDI